MGAFSSKRAGRDFTSVRHVNRTHVELGKKVVINKEGGFRLFDYVAESGGPTTVDYGNGTISTLHPAPTQPKLLTDLGIAFDVVILAVTAVILLKLALCAFRAIRRYRNYRAFHKAYIGEAGRDRRKAFRDLSLYGPSPESYNTFYHGMLRDTRAASKAPPPAAAAPVNPGPKKQRSASLDSTVIVKPDHPTAPSSV